MASGAFTFRAFLPLLPAVVALTAEPVHEEWLDLVEDEAACFMQSRASLKSDPRQLLSEAALAAFDSAVFAQTSVEVTSPKAGAVGVVDEERTDENALPAWLADGDGEVAQRNEEAVCSLEGLTPGVCAMAALARPAAGIDGQSDLDYANADRLERALFQEIEAALAGTHGGFSAAHLADVQEELSGFFAALPKNEAGRLDHATVRYALHQHFLRRHAWYMRSLNPVGEAQTPASPGEALRGQVPLHLQQLIEKREGGRGLELRELAALVATLGHLIQGDTAERLKAAYGAHGLLPNQTAGAVDVMDALKTYMAHFLSMQHQSGYAVTPEQARYDRRSIENGYSAWPSVVAMVDEAVAKQLLGRPETALLTFSETMSAAKEVMDKFESVSAQDCQGIKRDLTAMPKGVTGRVLLSDLHKRALEGSMLFAESTEYLATLGALDDSEPGAVSVLVPNYVYSPSNCLGTTSFFDMCCPNECEVIMERLEMHLHKPYATPPEVESIVDSIRAVSPLSEASLQELDNLVRTRGGNLPLHGYHFAQWLHQAFPSECPRPRPEDFAGARQNAEVPATQHEYQAVAKLPSITASKSDLMAELKHGEREEVVHPPVNASDVTGGEGGDLSINRLEAFAAQQLANGGLTDASRLYDDVSLAQRGLDVSPVPAASEESASVEEQATEQGTGGLNVRRLH